MSNKHQQALNTFSTRLTIAGMQYSRIISVLTFFFAFAFVFTSASPVLDTETAVVRRQDADITSILTKLHTDSAATAQAINAQAKEDPSEDKISPLFDTLVGQIDAATSAIAALEPAGTQKRQDPVEVSTLVATIITDITTPLSGVLDELNALPIAGSLFSGLDASLNQLLKGLEGLLAGLLNLVATLLVNVAGLLRRLALGLTLASLGL